jgi:hypothetical protein
MLTATELTDMRTMQALTFDQVATVSRRAYSDDGAGGQTETVSLISLPCRVAPATAGQRQSLAGQYAELQVWRVTFAALADVRRNDKISVLGKSLEVLAVLGAESRETARVTLCTERL